MTAIDGIEKIFAVAVLQQATETLLLRRQMKFIWNWDVRISQILLILGALGLLFLPHVLFNILIFICLVDGYRKMDGTFNGGSDHMTFLIALGLLLARAFIPLAMVVVPYIAIQLIFSYLLAGIAKIRKASWRSGDALQNLIQADFYQLPESIKSLQLPWKMTAWSLITFELLFPLSVLSSEIAYGFVALAILFHLLNFWVLGLNRFVLPWLAAYPALLFLASEFRLIA